MSSLLRPVRSAPSAPAETADNLTGDALASTLTSAQRRLWYLWTPLVAILAFVGIYGALLLNLPSTITQQFNEAMQTVGYLVATLCFGLAALFAGQTRLRWAWACIAAAFFTNVVAEVIYAYLALAQGQVNPFPSIADAFYLLFYPLIAIGIMLLPSSVSGTGQRIKTLLDASIVTTAFLAISVFWLIGPIYLAGADTFLAVVVSAAYPVGDLLIIAALLSLILGGIPKTYQIVYYWLTAGMICFVYADSLYTYLQLQGTYTTGTLATDPFWPAASLMMSVAPVYLIFQLMRSRRKSAQANDTTSEAWAEAPLSLSPATETVGRVIFPYLSLAVLVVLLFATHPALPHNSLFPALEILAVFLVGFVVTRQILTFRDLVDARVANARARQLDDLKDQFITSINHELRTPLMTLQTYTEVLRLRSDALTADRRKEVIDRIAHSSESLVALVQSVLDARQIERGANDVALAAVSVRETLDQAIALLVPHETSAPRDLHIVIPPDLTIWGDAMYLQQIFTNLLSNAVKYSAPGSPVEVRGAVAQEPSARMLPRSPGASSRSLSGGVVEITVRDYGLGIPAEQLPLLFHRFVRLPRDLASTVTGSGLGLYLSRMLAERMGGSLQVESSGVPGEGSTFYLRLSCPPMTSAAEALPISSAYDTRPPREVTEVNGSKGSEEHKGYE